MEQAVFGGGCFWCLDAQFRMVPGVVSVICGYGGGHCPNPDYESVCRGGTGHAELIQLRYDEATISYRQLIELFLACHDPTTRDRQGHDVGTQYRSLIICQSDEQRRIAAEVISEWNAAGVYSSEIVTEITEAQQFYPAEDYHQDYFARHPGQGYCRAVISPKIAEFRKLISRLPRSSTDPV